jgi:hypothetical protein
LWLTNFHDPWVVRFLWSWTDSFIESMNLEVFPFNHLLSRACLNHDLWTASVHLSWPWFFYRIQRLRWFYLVCLYSPLLSRSNLPTNYGVVIDKQFSLYKCHFSYCLVSLDSLLCFFLFLPIPQLHCPEQVSWIVIGFYTN